MLTHPKYWIYYQSTPFEEHCRKAVEKAFFVLPPPQYQNMAGIVHKEVPRLLHRIVDANCDMPSESKLSVFFIRIMPSECRRTFNDTRKKFFECSESQRT